MVSFTELVALATAASSLFIGTDARTIFTRADPASTDPNDDPFYAQPANISKYNNGALIDSRQIVSTILTAPIAYQVKYRTNDGQNKSVSTVATVWKPLIPRFPPAILSYQVAEDALNLDCAPSWAWVKNSGSDNANITTTEGNIVIPWALARGYYVVNPDAEGPNSTWLVGLMEGRAVLDGIRAAANYTKLNLANTQVGLYGYSGGAHSTVWAAGLQATYANELKVVGAAFGGTPVDLVQAFLLLNGSSQAILAGEAIFGLSAGYPQLEADFQTGADGLTDAGKQVETLLRSRKYCPASGQGNFNGTDWNSYFKKPLITNPTVISVTNRESLLSNVSSVGVPVPTFPRFQYHGNNDTTVPYQPELQYVQQQCSNGANIQFATFNGSDHINTAIAGLPFALAFVGSAFDGLTPRCKCGTTQCGI